jgi:hypothetical protein
MSEQKNKVSQVRSAKCEVRNRAILENNNKVRPHPARDKEQEQGARARIRRVAGIVGLMLLLAGAVQGSTITGNLRDTSGNAWATNALFAPLSTPQADGTTTIGSTQTNVLTDGAGAFSVVLKQGDYKVTLGKLSRDSFIISVPNDANSYNINDLISTELTYSYSFLPVYLTRPDVTTGKTHWVDGQLGNDNSARPNNFALRYKTIGAAKTNASAGDTIMVLPGTYAEANLMKADVSYYFYAGSVVSNVASGSGYGIFDDRATGAAGNFIVGGDGEFVFRNSNPVNGGALGAVVLTNPISRLTFKGKRLRGSSPNSGFFNQIYVANCNFASIKLDEVSDTFELWSDLDPVEPTFSSSGANGIYWENGDMHCDINRNFSSQYCLWSRDIGNTTSSLYYRGSFMGSSNFVTLYAQGGPAARGNLRTWIDCLEIYSGSGITISGLGAVKLYVTAQKISSATDTAIDASCELWLNAQKVSAAGKWINKLVSTGGGLSVQNAFIQVQQFEDLGSGMATGIFNSSTNDLYIIGGHIRGNGSFGTLVNHAGAGRTILDGTSVDGSAGGAAGYPVTVSSNGLMVRSSRILAGAAAETIHTNGVGANIVDMEGVNVLNKDVSPTLLISNGLYRVAGSTNVFSGTNFAGAVGDVLTKGPSGIYFGPAAAGGGGSFIPTINGIGTNVTLSGNLQGNVTYTNASSGETNTIVFSSQGIQGFAPGRSLWKLYSWFSSKVFEWGTSVLNTNGSASISVVDPTIPPLRLNVPSTHGTNTAEVYRDTSIIGGFDKDGFAFVRWTNSPFMYPATYTLWVQDTDGSDTNLINTQTSMLGTGVIGSKTFPTNFWKHGREGILEFEGQVWAPGTGGNCAFYAYAGTTLLNTGIAAPLANAAGDQYMGRLTLTCITNVSGTNLSSVGRITFGTSTRCTWTNMLTLLTDPTSPMAIDVKSTNSAANHSFLGKSARLMMTP